MMNGTDNGSGGSKNKGKSNSNNHKKNKRSPSHTSIQTSTPHGNNHQKKKEHKGDQQKESRPRRRFGPKAPQPRYTPKFGSESDFNNLQSTFHTRNLPLIRDSSQVPILIPGSPMPFQRGNKKHNNKDNKGNTQSDHSTQQQRRRRRKLPLVNASALLDASTYCQISIVPKKDDATQSNTSMGSEANHDNNKYSTSMNTAKRLLRGKKDLLDMLRGHMIGGRTSHPFCLAGHGVPPQLLQDHIQLADAILKQYREPAECSISSLSTSPMTTVNQPPEQPPLQQPQDTVSFQIRRHDGQKTTKFKTWPLESAHSQQRRHGISQEWADRLALYLAVMERITNKLGIVVGSLPNNNSSSKEWTITMYRGMAYPMELISSSSTASAQDNDGNNQTTAKQKGPVPILEWSPHSDVKQQPQVTIRLQGIPEDADDDKDGNNKNKDGKKKTTRPITLVYTASFRQ